MRIALEHELSELRDIPSIEGRRPDGYFTLQQADKEPSDIAIEVETTQRSQSRIRAMIESYRAAMSRNPDQIAGVLVVTNDPIVARAYRAELASIAGEARVAFLVSEKLNLSDVREDLLGRSISSISEHPFNPAEKKWISVRSSSHKAALEHFRRNIGDTRKNETASHRQEFLNDSE